MNIQNVIIESVAGYSLRATILKSENHSGKRPAILCIHGWTSQMARYESRVKPMVEMGFTVVLFDLRGHGETGGTLSDFSISDHFEDCKAAYDFMIMLDHIDTDNISLIGLSYGGYLATLLTSERKVHHLMLSVPALYTDDIFDLPDKQVGPHTTEYRKYPHTPDDNKALAALHDFSGDVFLLEVEHDEFLSPQVMKSYRAAAQPGVQYTMIEGADHNMKNPGVNEKRIRIWSEWFKQFAKE